MPCPTGCSLPWATTHPVLRPGQFALDGEEIQVLLEPGRRPGIQRLSINSSRLPFF